MKPRTTIFRIAAITVLSMAVILVVAGMILSHYALRKLELHLKSINAVIGSVHVNLFNQSISLDNLRWTYIDDSLATIPHEVTIKRIKLAGVSLYQLIRFKKIHVGTLTLLDGTVRYNRAIKPHDDPQKEIELSFQDIRVDRLALKNITATVLDDSLTEYTGTVNLSFDDVLLKDIKTARDIHAYEAKSFELLLIRLQANPKNAMYKTRVGQVYMNSDEKKIVIDSITLIPKLSKYKFSRQVGRQIDRFNLSVPRIAISGFVFNEVKDSTFAAAMVEIVNANLHVFRDKRLPFIRKKNMPLPIALIRSLSFGIAIDTIKITDAHITYEEFPEKGFRTGKLDFEKLNATIDHISNRNDYSNFKQATLIVTSRIMAKGTIKAEFSLPYGKEQIYNAKGTVSNLPLYHLNPILESLAFVSVESGKLNALNFDFDYNEIRSRGTILVNYEDLRISSLTREKESTINEFKTWALNVFLKKDKNHTVSKERRMGTIDFTRDRRRAIFNVWVRSLFSGLKSSVLDSPTKKEKENSDGSADHKKNAKTKKAKEKVS